MPGGVGHLFRAREQCGSFHQMAGIHGPTGCQSRQHDARKGKVIPGSHQPCQELVQIQIGLRQVRTQAQDGRTVELDGFRHPNELRLSVVAVHHSKDSKGGSRQKAHRGGTGKGFSYTPPLGAF